MKCRRCGGQVAVKTINRLAPKVTRYEDCLYTCETDGCRVAYSNCRDEAKRTLIFSHPRFNVPEPLWSGLEDVSKRSLNKLNRETKWNRLAFETSEDALTWSVFRYAQETNQLAECLDLDERVQNLFFWGVGFPLIDQCRFRENLENLLVSAFKEKPGRFSEPDVIIETNTSLIFVEVKYFAPNDCASNRPFKKYVVGNEKLFMESLEAISEAGYYELCRNWVIGSKLASDMGKRYRLVNLGRGEICADSARQFSKSLSHAAAGKFDFLSWEEFVPRLKLDNWMEAYLKKKRLLVA